MDKLPVGSYFPVNVYSVLQGNGTLTRGKGTANEDGQTFCCGDFDRYDLPDIGKKYKIIVNEESTGNHIEFLGICVDAGVTSCFKLEDFV